MPGGEGVFLPCSFWLADCLHLIGRKEEARELFERLLNLRNDVGLLSEEYDPRAKRQLGNFPQAFTHVAMINTANLFPAVLAPSIWRDSVTELRALGLAEGGGRRFGFLARHIWIGMNADRPAR